MAEELFLEVEVTYALWPGDGVFCMKISSSAFHSDLFQLVDHDGRVSELRPYRIGMPTRRPR